MPQFRTALVRLIALFVFAAPAAAQSDLYRVPDVRVEAEAETATMAREKAIAEGQIIAFDRLVEKLTLPEDRYDLPPTDPTVAGGFVTALEVPQEQTTSTRWIGTLNVRFDPQGVREYLRSLGVMPVEAMARPGVLVPLLNVDGDRYVLWDPTNSWLQAWMARSYADEQTPIITPMADDIDRDSLSVTEANNINRAALSLFAARYQVEKVYIARAFQNPATGVISGSLEAVDFASADPSAKNVARTSGATMDELRDRLAGLLAEDWKQQMAVRDFQVTEVEVEVAYNNFDEFRQIEQIIAKTTLIDRAQGRGITADGGLMTWWYRGQPYQLQQELNEKGATLSLRPDGGWRVQMISTLSDQSPYGDPAVNSYDPNGAYDPNDAYDPTDAPLNQPEGEYDYPPP